jgi:hypothetical protein
MRERRLRLVGANMAVLAVDCRAHPQVAPIAHEVIVR